MKISILLINPWIYDFAAADLWSSPLGLLTTAEYLSHYDTELYYIDCMDSVTGKTFGRGRYPKTTLTKPDCLRLIPRRYGRYGISTADFRARLKNIPTPDIICMTSIMSYWYPGVQQAVGMIRELWGSLPIVLGGIYATLWPEHAAETSGADMIYRGPISDNIRFGLNTFGFRLKELRDRRTLRDNPRWYRDTASAALLTSSGCPFRCSYCGSSQLHDTFRQRSPDAVIAEIIGLQKRGVKDIAFYDDALLVSADAHIKVILQGVLDHRVSVRFHCPNGLHARLIDEQLARLMRGAGFTTIRLGLETIDRGRQLSTGGKVSSDDLVRAVRLLKKQAYTKQHIGAYLLYGLPGQGLDEVRGGVEFLKGLGVRIHLAEFSPVPGTACWDELIRQGAFGKTIDPLLTNNSVFSHLFSGYDQEELRQLKLEVKEYNIS